MGKKMTVQEAAALWGLGERRVADLCKQKRIPGAKKEGGKWMLPANAERPRDNRVKGGEYRKGPKLSLPIGVSNYRKAVSEYYYVDKTMMIKEFLDEKPMVSLFTRPRRFGKTLNMDMLRTFFEKTEEDTSVYFRDKLIWKQGERYRAHQGKYPVIFITFKDVKKETWEKTLDHIVELITAEYRRHSELAKSDKVVDKAYYEQVVSGKANRGLFDMSLQKLSKMLHEHYGKAPIVIIDEYDTPIQQGHMMGFYDEVINFMRNLFSGVFKDNKDLSFGFLTGILRVAKESIFSGLNNLKVNSVLENKYGEYFGFTGPEVREMARYYSAEDKYDELCAWYDGYRFGNTEIFNPWSVINYFSEDCRPGAYWQSTGSNDIIGEILPDIDRTTYDKLAVLLNGETILSPIDTGVIYPQVKNNPASVFSFLLVAGYLKAVERSTAINGDFMCELALPNKEIELVYRKEILEKLDRVIPVSAINGIQEALYSGNSIALQRQLEQMLLEAASSFDVAGENFYHGFMLGLTAIMEPYRCSSNRESGNGRYDLQLKPRSKKFPGILIELKAGKGVSGKALQKLAQAAVEQIEEKKYDTEMRAEGVTEIVKFGVAFSGKNVAVVVG